MRFITEFELLTPFEVKNYKSNRAWSCAQMLGVDISRAFGWDERGETTLHGPVIEINKLEIEAFPMDKWIEFKHKLADSITEPFSLMVIAGLLDQLESFGKPAGAAKQLTNGTE